MPHIRVQCAGQCLPALRAGTSRLLFAEPWARLSDSVFQAHASSLLLVCACLSACPPACLPACLLACLACARWSVSGSVWLPICQGLSVSVYPRPYLTHGSTSTAKNTNKTHPHDQSKLEHWGIDPYSRNLPEDAATIDSHPDFQASLETGLYRSRPVSVGPLGQSL